MASTLDKIGDSHTISGLNDLARIAESAEQYEDMCEFTEKLALMKVKAGEDLTNDHRNLLSVAFKNVVGAQRASWRTLSNLETSEIDESLLDKYRVVIENNLEARCKQILKLLEEHLIPSVDKKNNEEEVFYKKMAGDYYRYMAEFKPDAGHEAMAEKHYSGAYEIAKEALKQTHPARLGLALNFSVCYYEILKKPDKACGLAKEAFDSAIGALDSLDDANYKDSTLIMQLLRDNLTLWQSEEDGDE